jgi:hypothetical protein
MQIQSQDFADGSNNSSCAVPWDRFTAAARVPQGPTDELVVWLGKLNQKMRTLRTARSRPDLCKEVLLENARMAAQAALRARQTERRQRWHALCASWDTAAEPMEEGDDDNCDIHADYDEEDDDAVVPSSGGSSSSLCDCSSCILCQRHASAMFGKCYCHVIFSPSPVLVDFSLTPATDLFVDVDESREMDNFFASLSSNSSEMSSAAKRKAEAEERPYKRCKA